MILATPIPLLEALRKHFLRGYDAGIPAYYLPYGSFSRIDLLDVSRFEVEYFNSLRDLEWRLHRSLESPNWLSRNEGIVLLKELRPQRVPISGNWEYRKGLLVIKAGRSFQLDPSATLDEALRETLERSLDGSLGWTTTSRPSDWRFQSLMGGYRSGNFRGRGYLVIGLDALVQRTLDEEKE